MCRSSEEFCEGFEDHILYLCSDTLTLAFRHLEGSSAEEMQDTGQDLFAEPWWASKLSTGSSEWWLNALDGVRLSELPGKQRVGLVNALVDLLRHLVSCKLSYDPWTCPACLLLLTKPHLPSR